MTLFDNPGGFLGDLGSGLLSSINEQFGIAENDTRSLDSTIGGGNVTIPYGKLGELASKIDKTANRQYIETGSIRNIRPRVSEILMQEPDITILIKKRMFSSLAENYRFDLMNNEEKTFIRAAKRIFHNKCKAIAAYERLTKIERIVKDVGIVNDFLLPQIFSAVDTLNTVSPGLIGDNTKATLETIRRVKAFSDPSFETTWLRDRSVPYIIDTGEGTGVIELTMVSAITCSNSVKMGGGKANLTIEDPYKLMVISNEDIEIALAQVTSTFGNNNFFKVIREQLEETTEALKNKLNQSRTDRGAATIRFFESPNTALFKRVRAIIDEEGREIVFNFNGGLLGIGSSVELDSSASEGTNGLKSGPERNAFELIISNIYQLMGLQQSLQKDMVSYNKKNNYVRRKLKLNFGGKNLIQPMDPVHIFCQSKTQADSRLTRGLGQTFGATEGGNILESLDAAVAGFENAIDDISASTNGGPGAGSYFENEKNLIAGPEFPNWLWSLMRNDFTRQSAGYQIFQGVTSDVSHTYSNGKYVLNVTCEDNTYYFKQGQINISPSTEVWNSALYDPLTPFDLSFNAASGFSEGDAPPLLDENVSLLNTKCVRAKLGRFRGLPIGMHNYGNQDAEPVSASARSASLFRKKFNDPDGLVYRWKEGIGSLVWSGSPHSNLSLGSIRSEASPNLTSNPFVGQDVMNVLSLLVTSKPYNFNTFIRSAVNQAKLVNVKDKNEMANELGSSSFYRGLIDNLTKTNSTWGNFVPFKSMIINEGAYSFLSSGEFSITVANSRINTLVRERAKRFDELSLVVGTSDFAKNPNFYKKGADGLLKFSDPNIDLGTLQALGKDIIELDAEISSLRNDFIRSKADAKSRSADGTLRIFGDDISFDTTMTDSGGQVSEDQRISDRRNFRRKLGGLTQRRLWKVKANDDANLFIVDDSYDKNYDIQAFERSLAGKLEAFKSTYSDVFSQIESVGKILDLEVFADSQGHVHARPPQYNRMPSSVFKQMIRDKEVKGIQIFPEFLESLFFNQVKGLTDQIEIVEDEIRVRAAALGFTDDTAAEGKLGSFNTEFKFLTSEITGLLGANDFRSLIYQANPDQQRKSQAESLHKFSDSLRGPLNATANFDINKRLDVVNNDAFSGVNESVVSSIERIGKRLTEKKKTPAPTVKTLLSNTRTFDQGVQSQLDTINLSSEIAQLISERQGLIKLMANAVKNLEQGITLDADPRASSNIFNNLFSQISDNRFPEILEHMIEHELEDDLGEGSGKRYILTDSKIRSLTIREAPPPWTVVEVNGQLDGGLSALPEDSFVTEGGNAIASAWAVDYDMWRQYGWKSAHSVQVPYLRDPEGQCAPYAVMLLNQARKNIFQGEAMIVGNEFVQAGEVYYVEDRDLLFYAETVSHSFTYGGDFSTTLSLTYGHNPGEYIPTMLDIIGKGLYTNRHQAELARHARHGNASGDIPITTLSYDVPPNEPLDKNPIVNLLKGTFGSQNRSSLSSALLSTTGILTPTSFGDKIKLEVRTYYNSDFGSADNDINTIANGVKAWLTNPSSISSDQVILPDSSGGPSPRPEDINVISIDLGTDIYADEGEEEQNYSPSNSAWNMARQLAFNAMSGTAPSVGSSDDNTKDLNSERLTQSIRQMLFTKVIDIWVTFVSDTRAIVDGSNSNTDDTKLNQQEIEEKNRYIAEVNQRFQDASDALFLSDAGSSADDLEGE